MYGLMGCIGALAAGIVGCRLCRKRGLNDNDYIITLLISAAGVFVGASLLYAITNYRYFPLLFRTSSLEEFWNVLTAIFGGMVFYGGLIGGVAAGIITVKVKKYPAREFLDISAVIIPLFHAFARVGCFLGGCCYGIECEIGFAAHGNPLIQDINDVVRFPVQLLESGMNLLIFAVLLLLYRKSLSGKFLYGKLIYFYLIMYSTVRFSDEYLRGDSIRGFLLGMSTSQFISLILIVLSSLTLIILRFRKNGRSDAIAFGAGDPVPDTAEKGE
ncbi:MAG: prolipoprotein diacylglyceryl transferase [Clostridia bacterium]|nr:prolipoprotein diacylglyceryl transferase [Clostridia bacterium]